MGDGTLGEGACHESMNMSATWKLPILYCLVNNQYAISTHFTESHPQQQLATWADGYLVKNETIDGNDIEIVIETIEKAAEFCRAGEGPYFIELMTYRWQGHFSGDPAAYRPEGELESWKEKDPIELSKAKLLERGIKADVIADIHTRVDVEIAEYVRFALESPSPDPEDGIKHIYMDIEIEGRK